MHLLRMNFLLYAMLLLMLQAKENNAATSKPSPLLHNTNMPKKEDRMFAEAFKMLLEPFSRVTILTPIKKVLHLLPQAHPMSSETKEEEATTTYLTSPTPQSNRLSPTSTFSYTTTSNPLPSQDIFSSLSLSTLGDNESTQDLQEILPTLQLEQFLDNEAIHSPENVNSDTFHPDTKLPPSTKLPLSSSNNSPKDTFTSLPLISVGDNESTTGPRGIHNILVSEESLDSVTSHSVDVNNEQHMQTTTTHKTTTTAATENTKPPSPTKQQPKPSSNSAKGAFTNFPLICVGSNKLTETPLDIPNALPSGSLDSETSHPVDDVNNEQHMQTMTTHKSTTAAATENAKPPSPTTQQPKPSSNFAMATFTSSPLTSVGANQQTIAPLEIQHTSLPEQPLDSMMETLTSLETTSTTDFATPSSPRSHQTMSLTNLAIATTTRLPLISESDNKQTKAPSKTPANGDWLHWDVSHLFPVKSTTSTAAIEIVTSPSPTTKEPIPSTTPSSTTINDDSLTIGSNLIWNLSNHKTHFKHLPRGDI